MSLEYKYSIPEEVGVILNELVESILINNPNDILEFCF